MLVDDIYARSQKLHVGQTVTLLNHPFHLAGIVEHGKGARIFVKLETLQDLMGSMGKASVFFVKLTRPEYTSAVMPEFEQLLPHYQIRNMQEYMSLMTAGNIPGLSDFINVMIALAICIGLLVIFITMYSTIVERDARNRHTEIHGGFQGLYCQPGSSGNGVFDDSGDRSGIGLSYLVRSLVIHYFPTMSILITGGWMLRASLIALGASLLGATYPAFRATRQDAIRALAYE